MTKHLSRDGTDNASVPNSLLIQIVCKELGTDACTLPDNGTSPDIQQLNQINQLDMLPVANSACIVYVFY